jgi:hypothetical protein
MNRVPKRSVSEATRALIWDRGGQIYFAGRWLSLWDSYGLGKFQLRAGNFSEDSRGRWYLNVCVPREPRAADERNTASVGSILDRSVPSVGIDLAFRMQLTISSRRDIAVLQKESSALEGEEDVKDAF